MHFVFQLELNILQNGNSLSLPSCSLEEESFEVMHKRGVIKLDLQFRKWVVDSSIEIEMYSLI